MLRRLSSTSLLSSSIQDLIRSQGAHLATVRVPADSDLSQAILALTRAQSASAIVTVLGIVTETDLLNLVARDPTTVPHALVQEAMTPSSKLVSLSPQDSLFDCIQVICEAGPRRLPVIDGENLVALLSVRDVLRFIYEAVKHEVVTQEPGKHLAKRVFLEQIAVRKGIPEETVIADSSSSKHRLQVEVGACARPHPDKIDSGGEDAHFSWLDPEKEVLVMGVADGVGSWSFEQNVNPSAFAKALMEGALTALKDKPESAVADLVSLSPIHLLTAGWEYALSTGTVGSSTACIMVLDLKTRELRASNLGDCGFLVLRTTSVMGSIDLQRGGISKVSKPQVMFRSPQQLHYFNCPYQLGRNTDASFSGFNRPQDSDKLRIPLISGDIVVLASDGLFDNLPEDEIIDVLVAAGDLSASSETLSQALVSAAYERSLDKDRDSPFAVLAKENNIMWGGGMPDDITVLVAKIK